MGGGRGGTEGLWEGDGEELKGCGRGTGRNRRAVGGGRGGTEGLWEGTGGRGGTEGLWEGRRGGTEGLWEGDGEEGVPPRQTAAGCAFFKLSGCVPMAARYFTQNLQTVWEVTRLVRSAAPKTDY